MATGTDSDVTIANEALTALGESPITAFTDTSKPALLATTHYASSRNEVLRAHPWNFAQVRVALNALPTPPTFGGIDDFAFYFELPTDPFCLRVLETDGDETKTPWRVEGRTLIYPDSSVSILYVALITDTSQYDSLFRSAVAMRLAAKIAYGITGSSSVAKDMYQLYLAALKEARSVDGQEGSARHYRTTSLTEVR